MNAMKMTVLSLALISSGAMANVIGDTAHKVAEGGKTFLKSSKPAGVGVEIGTLGYGANLSWGVTESTELQAGWNGGKLDFDTDIGGDDSVINWKKVLGDEYKDFTGNFKVEVKGDNPYIGLQTRPFKNAFTIGTGIIVPNHDIDATLTAKSAGTTITVNGRPHTLNINETVNIHAETRNKLAPYLTFGVRPNINSRFGISAEIGAAYVGNYKVNVDASNPNLRQDLEEEINKDNVAWYPVAKLGATLRF